MELVLSELPVELVDALRLQKSQYEDMTEEAYAGRLLSAAIQAAGQAANTEAEPEPAAEPVQEAPQESESERMYQLGVALNQCQQLESRLLTEFRDIRIRRKPRQSR